jgi:hypothetical protein
MGSPFESDGWTREPHVVGPHPGDALPVPLKNSFRFNEFRERPRLRVQAGASDAAILTAAVSLLPTRQ